MGWGKVSLSVLSAKHNEVEWYFVFLGSCGANMSTSSSTSSIVLVFNGEHYHIWVVKMRFYLRSQGLWNVVMFEADPPPLGANPTFAQMKAHEEEKLKKDTSPSYIQDLQTTSSPKSWTWKHINRYGTSFKVNLRAMTKSKLSGSSRWRESWSWWRWKTTNLWKIILVG